MKRNVLLQTLSRRVEPVVFLIWTAFIIYLLISRSYIQFLRPEFGILLALAYFIAMGFMFAAMIQPRAATNATTAILRALVLLIPVGYFILMPETRLGSQAFTKRFTGVYNKTTEQYPLRENTDSVLDSRSSPDNLHDAESKHPAELTILEIMLNPALWNGREVTVKGMFVRNDDLKRHFGGSDTAVYRFAINCCVADAMPLVIGLNPLTTDSIGDDIWVEVTGTFQLVQDGDNLAPMIMHARIKPIEEPAVPYLF